MHALRLALVSLTLGCLPTVELGSNAAGDPLASTTSGAAEPSSTGTPPSADSSSSTTDPDEGSGGGTQEGTTAAVVDSGDTSTGGSSEGSSSTGASQACADFFPREVPCLQCAELQCCDEIDLCLGQPECDCFLECLQGGNAAQCQAMCEPASGAAAVVTCLSLACVVACP